MGFFKAFGRVLAGKPIYEPGDIKPAQGQPQQPVQPAVPASPLPTTPTPVAKIIPVVRVTRVESQVRNGRMDVNLEIRNESPVMIWIDKVFLLGAMRDLNDDLPPGSSHEFQIYSGPPPQNESHREAEVQYYTDKTRDYFSARHQVMYQRQSDGLHIKELRLELPIRDLR
jgi:hypothetical protein